MNTAGNVVNPNCSVTCQFTQLQSCGDKVLQNGEECDDGNTRDGDGCTSLCKFEKKFCVDSTLCEKNTCGGGSACKEAFCGDSITQGALGEQCDDGNGDNNDDCDNNCQWVALEECGDGIVQSEYEQCDNGKTPKYSGAEVNSDAPNAECRTNCTWERCGDGIFDSFIEACDDGNNVNGDRCNADCTLPAGAAPPIYAGDLISPTVPRPNTPTYYPPTIPTPARTPTGPGLVIFLASGAAAGVGIVRRRFLDRK